MPEPDANTKRYFDSMCGAWAGAYRFEITDFTALRKAVPRRFDRLRVRAMHSAGRATMRTTVSWTPDGDLRHTTRVSTFGLPGMLSTELFRLSDDGRTFAVSMCQRFPPLFRLRTFAEGRGEVTDPLLGADYRLPWLGGEIDQRARITSEGVELTQACDWFRASVLLRRKSGSK